MSGSHTAALKFAMARIQPETRVLDVGAGMSPLAGRLAMEHGCRVLAVDINRERLMRGWESAGKIYEISVGDICGMDLPCGGFDAVAALYSLQCMIGYEPQVWVLIRQWLKKGGKFIAASRYRLNSPQYEGDRGDPLYSQDEHTIRTLAEFCGFSIGCIETYFYDEASYNQEPVGSPKANAVLFELVAK